MESQLRYAVPLYSDGLAVLFPLCTLPVCRWICCGTAPLGLQARAVIVLDENNVVKHAQLVPEMTNEPDYAAALAALG